MKNRLTQEQIVASQGEAECDFGQGSVPPARVLGGELLPLAQQIRWLGGIRWAKIGPISG
jgi:hypothetical protein